MRSSLLEKIEVSTLTRREAFDLAETTTTQHNYPRCLGNLISCRKNPMNDPMRMSRSKRAGISVSNAGIGGKKVKSHSTADSELRKAFFEAHKIAL